MNNCLPDAPRPTYDAVYRQTDKHIETHRETDRTTHRQTDRQTHRQTDRVRERQRDV